LIFEEKYNKKKLFHFIIPSLLTITLTIANNVDQEKNTLVQKVFILIGFLASIFYMVKAFILLYKNVWFRKSDVKIVQGQNKLIRNWTLFLFCLFLFIFVFRFSVILFYYETGSYGYNLIWIPALAWCFIFLKFILTPEIQYGYNFLNQNIEKAANHFILSKLWSPEIIVQKINIARDEKLAEKLKAKIKTYIHQIEEASFNSHIFRNPDLTTDDIATHINIPPHHVSFVFKYHCLETFSNYKKFVRVQDAMKLIGNGYLINNTVESLSAEVGFITYNTFHVTFKSIKGMTTQEYIKRVSQPTG